MLLRSCIAAIATTLLLIGSAQAQMRSQPRLPDPRGEFVRQCAPHMVGRWAHPESVCGCLHDYAAATVEDSDLREALLRGISETGVPTIETHWVPAAKQSQIAATFTKACSSRRRRKCKPAPAASPLDIPASPVVTVAPDAA
jgi:hypothetical protein